MEIHVFLKKGLKAYKGWVEGKLISMYVLIKWTEQSKETSNTTI